MANVDPIGLMKSVLWEEAKGKLRALAAASGQVPSTVEREPAWERVTNFIEMFITNFESHGYHE
jgi:hypothetical protein